jgi:centromeric protein E
MLGPDEVVDVIKEGVDDVSPEMQMNYGIIPRAVIDIFSAINTSVTSDPTATFDINVSYLEIYNEQVNNMLTIPSQRNLRMREMKNGNIAVLNCEPQSANSPERIFELLKYG